MAEMGWRKWATNSGMGYARFESRAGFDFGGHQFSVGGEIEQFLAVAPPARFLPSTARNLPSTAKAGEGRNVDLPVSGFAGCISNEFSIGRKLRVADQPLRLQ